MPKRRGRPSAAQTKAPASDRIHGSEINPKGSAASESSASKITLSQETTYTLKRKLIEFKEKHPSKDVTLNDLKAVWRRGAGAYSKSHRPTITDGKPNTRSAWAMARVNKFLEKAAGHKVKKAYVQDDDLLYQEGGTIDNGLWNLLYPEIKELFKKNGVQLQPNYSFNDGSNKSYLPHFAYLKEDNKIVKATATYFAELYEIYGEIVVEIEDNIEVGVYIPELSINEEIEFYENGGKLSNPFSTENAEKERLIQSDLSFFDKMLICEQKIKTCHTRENLENPVLWSRIAEIWEDARHIILGNKSK
jgi:hypothetical protein